MCVDRGSFQAASQGHLYAPKPSYPPFFMPYAPPERHSMAPYSSHRPNAPLGPPAPPPAPPHLAQFPHQPISKRGVCCPPQGEVVAAYGRMECLLPFHWYHRRRLKQDLEQTSQLRPPQLLPHTFPHLPLFNPLSLLPVAYTKCAHAAVRTGTSGSDTRGGYT